MIGTAVMVGRIPTGEIVEVEEKFSAAAELGRKAKAAGLSQKRRNRWDD